MKQKLTDKKAYPKRCEYCKRGRLSPDGKEVLCPKKGLVNTDYVCSAYKYDPLKRIPRKQLTVEHIDASEFEL